MDRSPAKDDVRDALLANEGGGRGGDAFAFDGEDLGVEITRKLHVGCRRAALFLGNIPGVDMQDEQFAAYALGYSCAACNQHLGGAVRADADRDPFAHSPVCVNLLRVHIGSERAVDGLGHVLQRQLAKRDQIAAAKEVGERLLRAIDAVDIAAPHAGLERLRRQIGHYDLVRALYHPVRHGFADLNSGNALDGRRNALDMLHVHRCENIDVGGQYVEHILIAFAVLAAFDVAMSQFVDQDDLGPSRQYAVQIHLLKDDALVLDPSTGDLLELIGQLCGSRAAVSLDHTDHNVFSALVPPNRLAQHVVGFAYAWRVAEEEFKRAASLLRRNLFQPFFRALRRGSR